MSARRIDYYDDPDAPAANSLVPSANVVVVNDAGELLLIHRTDNDNWALPGGAMDLGESLVDTAVRETREETGIACEVTGLVGIYTDPRHVILYTSNGEARQEFSVVFTARPISGVPTTSSETREVEWVERSRVDALPMDRSMRLRIEHYLSGRHDAPPGLTGVLSADWASVVVDAVAAIGTLGAFAVGFVLFRREHRREEARAEDQRRSQAVKVSAWVEAQRTAQGGREVLFLVHNASDMPIYEVSLPTPDEGDGEAEFIGLVPPGQTIQRPAPREWLATYYAPEPVEIEFLDSSGRQWTRNEQGFIAPTSRRHPRPPRRRLRFFRRTR